jgi:PHD/YefM family antitoxin component YafN of YafNO toxin-antitoxin module
MELHPQIIEKEGRKEFVVLPFEEYQALTELMYDYEDLRDLREAKEESKDQESVSLDKVISDLGFLR